MTSSSSNYAYILFIAYIPSILYIPYIEELLSLWSPLIRIIDKIKNAHHAQSKLFFDQNVVVIDKRPDEWRSQ